MEINWILVITCFLVNACYLLIQLGLQYWDLAHGRIQVRGTPIPGTSQLFLYMQDFATNSWGDLFGLSLIQIGFAHLLFAGHIAWSDWNEFILVATIASGIFLSVCLRTNHRPDSGFPEIGKIGLSGMWHVPYFGINAAISVIDIRLLFGPLRGPVMWLVLTGGAIYAVTAAYDIVRGNFTSLHSTSSTPSCDH